MSSTLEEKREQGDLDVAEDVMKLMCSDLLDKQVRQNLWTSIVSNPVRHREASVKILSSDEFKKALIRLRQNASVPNQFLMDDMRESSFVSYLRDSMVYSGSVTISLEQFCQAMQGDPAQWRRYFVGGTGAVSFLAGFGVSAVVAASSVPLATALVTGVIGGAITGGTGALAANAVADNERAEYYLPTAVFALGTVAMWLGGAPLTSLTVGTSFVPAIAQSVVQRASRYASDTLVTSMGSLTEQQKAEARSIRERFQAVARSRASNAVSPDLGPAMQMLTNVVGSVNRLREQVASVQMQDSQQWTSTLNRLVTMQQQIKELQTQSNRISGVQNLQEKQRHRQEIDRKVAKAKEEMKNAVKAIVTQLKAKIDNLKLLLSQSKASSDEQKQQWETEKKELESKVQLLEKEKLAMSGLGMLGSSSNGVKRQKRAESYLATQIAMRKRTERAAMYKILGRDITGSLNNTQLEQLADWTGQCLQQLVDTETKVDQSTKFAKVVAANRPSKADCITRLQVLRRTIRSALIFLFMPLQQIKSFFGSQRTFNLALQQQLVDENKVGRAILTLDSETPGDFRLVGRAPDGKVLEQSIAAQEFCKNGPVEKCNVMDWVNKRFGVVLIINATWAKHFKVPTTLTQQIMTGKKGKSTKDRALAHAQLARVLQDYGIVDIKADVPKYIDSDDIMRGTFGKHMNQKIKEMNKVQKVYEEMETHNNLSQIFLPEQVTDDYEFHAEQFMNVTVPADQKFIQCSKDYGVGGDLAIYANTSKGLIEDIKKAKAQVIVKVFKYKKNVPKDLKFVRVNTLMVQPVLLSFMITDRKTNKSEWYLLLGDLWFLSSIIRNFKENGVPFLYLEINELTEVLISILAKYNLTLDLFKNVLYSRYWAPLIMS
jgi:hypothetical protein